VTDWKGKQADDAATAPGQRIAYLGVGVETARLTRSIQLTLMIHQLLGGFRLTAWILLSV
jgi:hypothetical protein